MSHRIGYLRKGYDADLVIWDSHPLHLGATPKQVWIDGLAQLSEKYTLQKAEELQSEPSVPKWDKEIEKALEYQGLQPLEVPSEKRKKDAVVFVGVNEVMMKDATTGAIQATFSSRSGRAGTVVVEAGKITCTGDCSSALREVPEENIIDLAGGSIMPGLTTYGGGIGTVEIQGEPSTNDGATADLAQGKRPEFLEDVIIQAVDGVLFGGRNTLFVLSSPPSVYSITDIHLAGQTGISFGRNNSDRPSLRLRRTGRTKHRAIHRRGTQARRRRCRTASRGTTRLHLSGIASVWGHGDGERVFSVCVTSEGFDGWFGGGCCEVV